MMNTITILEKIDMETEIIPIETVRLLKETRKKEKEKQIQEEVKKLKKEARLYLNQDLLNFGHACLTFDNNNSNLSDEKILKMAKELGEEYQTAGYIVDYFVISRRTKIGDVIRLTINS